MKWLHLSDLHFNEYDNSVKKMPFTDLKAYLGKEGIQADTLFITGDFRYAKEQNDYTKKQDAENVVKKIMEIAEIVGIADTSSIYVVPGNHDLNIKTRTRMNFIKSFTEEYYDFLEEDNPAEACFDELKSSVTYKAFDFYRLVQKKIFDKKVFRERWKLFKEQLQFVIRTDELNIFHLNTVLLFNNKRNGNRPDDLLYVGYVDVCDSLVDRTNQNLPTIVLAHHSILLIPPEEQRIIAEAFQKYNVQLMLCGHEHRPGNDSLKDINTVNVGCLKVGSRDTCNFSVGEYDGENFTISMHTWTFSSGWGVDRRFNKGINNGKLVIKRPKQADLQPITSRDGFLPEDYFENDINDIVTKPAKTKQSFIDYLSCCDVDLTVSYILSGPNSDNPISNRLPSTLFFEEFFVSPSKEHNDEIRKISQELFDSNTYNLLCLKSGAGTGKTTFLKHLVHDYFSQIESGETPGIYYIVFNCTDNNVNKSGGNIFPSEFIKQKFKKLCKNMVRGKIAGKSSWFDNFMRILRMIAELKHQFNTNHDNFIETAKMLYRNKEVILVNYSKIPDDAMEDANNFTKLAMYVLLQVSKSNRMNKKYMIVFDNLEAYTATGSYVGEEFYRLLNELENLFDGVLKNKGIKMPESFSFINDITFVLSLRPTTHDFMSQHSTPDFMSQHYAPHELFGVNDKYIYTREYFDFTVEAVLKKLKFLHMNNINKTFTNEVTKICKLLIPGKTVNDYLRNDDFVVNDDDLKIFSTKKLLPFFNNNFRAAIAQLRKLYQKKSAHFDKTWMQHILDLNERYDNRRDSIDSVKVGFSRMILFKSVFDYFVAEEFFEYYGFTLLDHSVRFSLTRILLCFLYWKQAESDDDFCGVSIDEIIGFLKGKFGEDEIVDTIVSLCEYCDSKEKHKIIEEWGYMITFVRGLESDIRRSMTERNNLKNIKIKLSSAGWCFVDLYSSEFEFFSSRIPDISKDPLVLFNNKTVKVQKETKYEFDTHIKVVFDRTKLMLSALKDTASKLCSGCDSNPASCFEFICYKEIFSVLTRHIDYIDNYRRYMWDEYRSKAINDVLLDRIGDYGTEFSNCANKWKKRCSATTYDVKSRGAGIGRKEASQHYYARDMSTKEWADTIVYAKNELTDGSLYRFIEAQK